MKASEAFERVIVNCTAPGTCFEKTEEGAALMKRFNVKGWPHVIFLDPMGEQVRRVQGGCGAVTYRKAMEHVAERFTPQRRLQDLTAEGDRVRVLARVATGEGPAAEKARAELRALRDAAAAALATASGR